MTASKVKYHTILEINQTTAVKLDISHWNPGCDAGGITISQENLIVVNLTQQS